MAQPKSDTFKFQFENDQFGDNFVVQFNGKEALSECWTIKLLIQFKISDLKTDGKFSLKKLLNLTGQFKLITGGDPIVYFGRIIEANLSAYSEAQYAKEFCFIDISFVPELYTLSYFTRNRTFLNMDVKTLLKNILKTNPAIKADYKFSKTYTSKPIANQKEESDLHFLNRIISQYGLFYGFETDDDGNYQVVFRDSVGDNEEAYTYHHNDPEYIADLTAKMKSVPNNVRIRDYNHRSASSEIDASLNDNKQVMEFIHNNVKDEEEAKNLAKIRYDQLIKDMLSFSFISDIRGLNAGVFLKIETTLDDPILIVERRLSGHQASLLSDQLRKMLNITSSTDLFVSTVTAVFSDVCYRPNIDFLNHRVGLNIAEVCSYDNMVKDTRPTVDTKPSSPVDKDGNYNLWFRNSEVAVDDTTTSDDPISVRNMTPYAGVSHGFHMPLQTGDEVITTYENANIDNPLIQGSVNNSNGAGLYKDKETTMHTTGNNILTVNDDSLNGIEISTPAYNSSLKMGKIDDENAIHLKSDKGILIKGKSEHFELEAEFKITGGNNYNIRIGAFQKILLGLGTFVLLGANLDLKFDLKFDFSTMKLKCHGNKISIAGLKHTFKGECTKITDEQQEVIDTKIESYTEDDSAQMEEITVIKDRLQGAINTTADSVEACRVCEERVEALALENTEHVAHVRVSSQDYGATVTRVTDTAVEQATTAVDESMIPLRTRTGAMNVNLTGFRKCGAV